MRSPNNLHTSKRIVALPLLAILLVSVALAGPALGASNIWILSADATQDSVLAGESVPVEVNLKNSGDGGAVTLDVAANGTVVASERVQMDARSEKRVNVSIGLDEPGTYKLRVHGVSDQSRGAGRITVTRFRVAEVTERDDGRTALLRAGEVESGTELTADFPPAENVSFALERTTMTSSGERFNRSVSTYAPTDGAPFSVPDGEGASVVGAVDMESVSGVDTTSVQVAVDRSALRESGLDSDNVVVYRRTNGSYVPLETERTSSTSDRAVYEATTDGGERFVVGSLEPAFAVESKRLATSTGGDGKQITLTATVRNDGPIAGDYVAEMRVDGTTVSDRTVSVPAGESRTIDLNHTVTAQGDYEVALGNQSVGSVVWTGDGVSTADPAAGDDSVSDDSDGSPSEVAGGPLDAAPSLPSLPSLGDVGVIELGIGAGVVLVGGGLLLLLRG